MDLIPAHTLIRSRRRTLSLQITPDAQLIIRAPHRVSDAYITKVVHQKLNWILNKQKQFRDSLHLKINHQFCDGEQFLYLGELYPLRVVNDDRIVVRFFENEFQISVSALSKAKKSFETWYRQQAMQVISDRVKYYATVMGCRYTQIKLSSAKRRWGSCSSKGSLNFSWRLMLAPLFVIDYVVVHELTHLIVHSHGPKFWDKVRVFYPQYAEAKKWLKIHRHQLEF